MSKIILTVIVFSIYFEIYAQPNKAAVQYADRIRPADLRSLLEVIASDSLEGRKTGTEGQKKAGTFISNYFSSIGLEKPVAGSYFQTVPLYTRVATEGFVAVGKRRLTNFKDIVYTGFEDLEDRPQVLFVGNQASLDELKVNGKAVVLHKQGSIDYELIDKLKRQGATLVLLCNTGSQKEFDAFASTVRESMARLRYNKPTPVIEMERVVFLSPAAFEAITGFSISSSTSAPSKAISKTDITYKLTSEVATIESENVLGYLEGTDKKDEVLIISAHYDHIGKRSAGAGDLINNGADDDGSGTVTVMELAEAFAKAKESGNGPLRSILFITVTGEEIGLFGSQYYTENPIFPLENTVANLNIDMIGRSDPSHRDSADYVYIIGSDKLSSELHQLSERTNAECCNLSFDYLYNDVNHPSNLYKRSDHWNFAKNNIPIIFYFDGIHEDYHKPSDEIDKIDFELLTKRAQLIFYTAWEIANRKERFKID